MKNYLILIILALMITACSRSHSDYSYQAKNTDPIVNFISDFSGDSIAPVHFKVNIDKPDSTKCDDFVSLGYYFPQNGSFFVLASKNEILSEKVPANNLISIMAYYNVGGEGSCYAPIQQFTAEPGKKYLVKYEVKNKFCKLDVTEQTTSQIVESKVVARSCLRK
ncbi:hypothetical protein GCM10023211_08340 [Orbus sasakiae]|uniref:Lipoprotein n=1 Tax=Orbus sasakiae TaxID=1078475 RepID=A0ABP9N290_9GAMM